ncbi:hypothetical protein EJD97_011062 [Solanum chilense]|uniref:Uncharacterized protein n=1 Tax=Solanum chilense TaxID=4083 RepID=A0A6N2AHQ2_SOLCI|nr:hypothetical protein EJD97_011062 [Solanum chilense]
MIFLLLYIPKLEKQTYNGSYFTCMYHQLYLIYSCMFENRNKYIDDFGPLMNIVHPKFALFQ